MIKSQKNILSEIYRAWDDFDEKLIRIDDLEGETLPRGEIFREAINLERSGLIKILHNGTTEAYSITEKGIQRINRLFFIKKFLKIIAPIATIIGVVVGLISSGVI